MTNSPDPATPTGPAGPAASSSAAKAGTAPGKPAGPMTLTGTVVAGVEPNCVLLDNYLLVGGPRELLTSGKRVTVTGRVQADLMTTCQQGTPFVVETAKPA